MARWRYAVSTFLLCCGFASVASAQNIEDGLVLYLPMNEGAGKKVKDLSPMGFETEMSGDAPTWVASDNPRFATALEFDGTSNFVMIDMEGQGADINGHADPDAGLSICAWVKVLDTALDAHGQNRQPVVMKGSGAGWEFALYVYDGFEPGMSVWDCGGSGVSEPSGGQLGQDTWHYQCGVFNAEDGVMVFLDGEDAPVAEAGVGGGAVCDGPRPVFIAHREDGQWLNAQIAEVRMWNRVISTEDINVSMNTVGGLAVQPAGKLTTMWGALRQGS
ncbi:LamG domain-containing protein [Candidatus Poribacteria bacterium]|jgi:hypothetical protein|nr:LamG domain-containing protein [Candidatus Poribacteria bacterium]MBT5536309.1 LamG domain-containing protein [Candidatus Poribacteria bacterium]MBT5715188.1 LamG domain-containing protein [Candidatus Poribacteria bacterium]MBT7803840.1 LamG domain-containing protein [Candidatus Poribacteria bacterium]